MKLLSNPLANPKVAKNADKLGVLTAPLHLAPYNVAGVGNVCPKASQGCAAACLHTAGVPWMMKAKNAARIARTRAFMRDRKAFIETLAAEVAAHERKALAMGFECAVRLNATSDLAWERLAPELFEAFPAIQWYDYTKIAARLIGRYARLPQNYHLTFSLSETNEAEAIKVLDAGHNVAVVFSTSRLGDLPKRYHLGKPRRVIDGDLHDYRPADPRGVIVGLRAKGKARRDVSGFVRHV